MPQGITARAADALLDRVLHGAFPPGAALPSETELAGELGVSRLTVREAIKSLAGTRVLTVRQGRSSVVNPMKQWSPLDPRLFAARVASGGEALPAHLMEVRRVVEGDVAALAAERRSPAQLDQMTTALRAMREADAADDREGYVDAVLTLRRLMVEAADNVYLDAMLAPITEILDPTARAVLGSSGRRSCVIAVHADLVGAIERGDGELAREAYLRHLDAQAADPGWCAGAVAGDTGPQA